MDIGNLFRAIISEMKNEELQEIRKKFELVQSKAAEHIRQCILEEIKARK